MTLKISEIVQAFLKNNFRNLLLLAVAISIVFGTLLTLSSLQQAEREAQFFAEGMKPYLLGLALGENEEAIRLYIDEVNHKSGHQFKFDYENAQVTRPAIMSNTVELKLAGHVYGRLIYFINPLKAIPWLAVVLLIAIVSTFAIFTQSLFRSTGKLIEEHIVSPLERLAKNIETTDDLAKNFNLTDSGTNAVEVRLVERALAEATRRIVDTEKKLRESAIDKVRVTLTQQVAHDIRSPLAALEMITPFLADLPEDRRLLLRHAIGRISDIANNLLDRNSRNIEEPQGKPHSTEFLPTLISSLISEKREQYRSRTRVEIEAESSPSDYNLFVSVNLVELGRVISNLINNAVEAIDETGKVRVLLNGQDDGYVRIIVTDTGKGISPETLPKLMQKGVTFGKINGSGLGLAHARECIESWDGHIRIDSTEGVGTTVELILPRASAPVWFTDRLVVEETSTIVVIDDDPSIHAIWNQRFSPVREAYALQMVHLYSADALREWVTTHNEIATQAKYLIDYELGIDNKRKCPVFGLDVLLELGLNEKSILVTSRADQPELRQRCEIERVKMIPKEMARFVPISLDRKLNHSCEILIDDDPLIHLAWQASARKHKKQLLVFHKPDEFISNFSKFDRATPIYIDSNLGNGIKGEHVAKKISSAGFENIHLATGDSPESFPKMPWIKKIIGKDPPWERLI